MKKENKNYTNCVAHCGFSLVETLVVIGIVLVLLGLILPSLGSVRGRSARLVCAAELRDMTTAISAYASMERGYVPFSFQPTQTPGVWRVGNTQIDPASFSTAGDFWARPMLDSYGGSWLSESLLCPEDGVSEAYGRRASEQTGIPLEELGVPLVREISRSFYYAPASLRDDLPVVEASDCMVATLDDISFPSRKALIVETLPFHMRGFIGPEVSGAFLPMRLNVAAADGSVAWRSQADAEPGVLVGLDPNEQGLDTTRPGWMDEQRRLAAFMFTRDGVHGRDW